VKEEVDEELPVPIVIPVVVRLGVLIEELIEVRLLGGGGNDDGNVAAIPDGEDERDEGCDRLVG